MVATNDERGAATGWEGGLVEGLRVEDGGWGCEGPGIESASKTVCAMQLRKKRRSTP
jgi:hypothetical protein